MTNRQRSWLLLVLAVLVGPAGAPAADTYRDRPLANLSERSVSRRGATALQMPGVTWDHGESAHFIFHFEQGFLRPLFADQAERFYGRLKSDLQVTNDTFQRKVHLFVFLNTNSWSTFLGDTRADPWTGGFWTGRELFLRARANPKRQDVMLAHELGHLVLQRFIGANLPVWLNEGFAHFEGQRLMSQYLRVRLKPKGYRILNRFEPMDQARLVPLDVLTTAVDYPADPARVVDFYRQSELLVAFLHDQHGEMEPLAEFLHHQNRGLRFPAALAEVYGIDRGDRERFETAFRRYATGADQ